MKKYKEYMREGITLSKSCLRQNGLFKFYIYSFLNMILSLTFFLAPFAGVAKYEIKNQVRKNKGIILTTMFRGCDNHGYSRLLVANILKGFMYLSAFLAIGLVGFVLYMLGIGIVHLANFKYFIANFFYIPAIVIAVIFIIAIPYIQGPNAYFINRFGHLSATGILYNSFRAYQDGGRKVSFLINLTCYLPKILILGLGVGVSYGISSIFGFSKPNGQGAFYVSLAIFMLIYIIVSPLFTLVHAIAKTELFDDIVSDRYFSDTHTENPNEDYRRIKILKHSKQKSYKLLFDDADKYMDSESYINSLNEIKEAEAKEREKALEEAKKKKEELEAQEDTIADVLEENENDNSNVEAPVEEEIDPNVERSYDDFEKSNLASHEKHVTTEEDYKKPQVNNPEKPEDDDIKVEETNESQEEVQETTEELEAEDNQEEIVEEVPVEEPAAEEVPEETLSEEPQLSEEAVEEAPAEEPEAEEVQEDTIADDVIIEEVEEEQVIYVDEDGNEIPADEIEFIEEEVEEPQEEPQEVIEEIEEAPVEEPVAEEAPVEEAPKKTRAKSTTAKKTSTTKKSTTEKKPAAKKTTAKKSTTTKKTTKKTTDK